MLPTTQHPDWFQSTRRMLCVLCVLCVLCCAAHAERAVLCCAVGHLKQWMPATAAVNVAVSSTVGFAATSENLRMLFIFENLRSVHLRCGLGHDISYVIYAAPCLTMSHHV